jgi:hypothetical protein
MYLIRTLEYFFVDAEKITSINISKNKVITFCLQNDLEIYKVSMHLNHSFLLDLDIVNKSSANCLTFYKDIGIK